MGGLPLPAVFTLLRNRAPFFHARRFRTYAMSLGMWGTTDCRNMVVMSAEPTCEWTDGERRRVVCVLTFKDNETTIHNAKNRRLYLVIPRLGQISEAPATKVTGTTKIDIAIVGQRGKECV